MGQKVNPHGLRVGVIKDWDSKWFADKKDFADYLVEDYKIREYLKKKLKPAGISKIEIERKSNRVKIIAYVAKPGLVIGKNGVEVAATTKALKKMLGIEDDKADAAAKKAQAAAGEAGDKGEKLVFELKEIKRPDREAQLVAENIAGQLENRISYRRAMKSAMSRATKSGVQGIKAAVSGRLGGADIARSEFYSEGTIPLQTLRADIDYGFAEADTTYGKLGVKVWIYKGEVLPTKAAKEGSDK